MKAAKSLAVQGFSDIEKARWSRIKTIVLICICTQRLIQCTPLSHQLCSEPTLFEAGLGD